MQVLLSVLQRWMARQTILGCTYTCSSSRQGAVTPIDAVVCKSMLVLCTCCRCFAVCSARCRPTPGQRQSVVCL